MVEPNEAALREALEKVLRRPFPHAPWDWGFRFPEPIRLTPSPTEKNSGDVLYAVGRDDTGRVLVQVERDGALLPPDLLLGFYTHAPGLVATIDRSVLDALPTA